MARPGGRSPAAAVIADGSAQSELNDPLRLEDIRSTRRHERAAKQRCGSVQSLASTGPDAGSADETETGTQGDSEPLETDSAIVDRFIASWKDQDLDRILDFFADDAVYINIPIDPPSRGKEQIRKVIEGFIGMSADIEFVVHQQIADGDGRVMNERTDRFLVGERWIELPVMGVFELRGGKISAWRDYFDMGMFQQQLQSPPG